MKQKKHILILSILIKLIYISKCRLIFQQPAFFKAFHCNLGQKAISDSGFYVCASPRVIPQLDKYGLSLMEFNKAASVKIKFDAEVVCCTGTDVTSVTLRIEIKSNFVYKLGFIVVAIGAQPSNDWISLINYHLPDDPYPTQNPVYGPTGTSKNFIHILEISSSIVFSSTNSLQFLAFISSFGVITSNPSLDHNLNIRVQTVNSTHFSIQLLGPARMGFQTLRCMIFIFNPTNISPNFLIARQGLSSSTNLSNSINAYGPSYSPKCIIGFDKLRYFNQDFSVYFLNTSNNHYETQTSTGMCPNMQINMFCLTSGNYECDQLQPFRDQYTSSCYASQSSCPAPTLHPDPVPAIPPYMCKKCNDIDCLECQVLNRDICTSCDATKNAILETDNCPCITSYYRPTSISPCKINCTANIDNCLQDSCTSTTNCTQCSSGFGLQLFGSDYKCTPCPDKITNCALCKTVTKCIECIPTYGLTTTNQCSPCLTLINNCVECIDYDSCTKCQVGYLVDVSNQSCKPCSYFIPNCSQCKQNLFSSKSQCTLCEQSYYINEELKCTKVDSGCDNFIVINFSPICLTCFLQKKFEFDTRTKTCVCQFGYKLNFFTEQCKQQCSDGIRAGIEACDDKNLQDGDGCNSKCQLQNDFDCHEDINGVTTCLFLPEIQIFYDYMIRHLGENKASMYFSVKPSTIPFNKINWKQAVTFNVTEVTVSSVSYSDGILVFQIDYTANLDDKIMQIDVKFDPFTIKSQNLTKTINLEAINAPLTYESGSQQSVFKALNLSGSILGLICLFCYLIATYFHKMIGLETLQFIQLIYFVRLIFPTSVNPSFYSFNSLKYSNGFNDIFPQTINSTSSIFKSVPSAFLKLNLNLLYLQNCNTMLTPITLAVLVYLVYFFKKNRARSLFLENKDLHQKDKYIILKRQVDWIYENFIFAYTLSLLYITTFQLMLYQLSKSSIFQDSSLFFGFSYSINLMILYFLLVIYSFEIITGIKNYISLKYPQNNVKNEEKDLQHDQQAASNLYHPLYVSAYLGYQFFLIVMLNLVFMEFKLLPESILVVSFIYLLIISFWKPYTQKIHNIAIIFNQSVAVGFLIIQLFNKYNILGMNFYNVSMFLVIGLITCAIILELIRLFIYYKTAKNALQVKLQEQNQVKKKHTINENNPYSFQNQIIQEFRSQNQNIQSMFQENHPVPIGRQKWRQIMNKKGLTLNLLKLNDPPTKSQKLESLFVKVKEDRQMIANPKTMLQRTKLRLKLEIDCLNKQM